MGEDFNPAVYLRTLTKRKKIRDPRGNEQWVEETHLYLDVKYRLLWFRNVYPEGFVDTVELEVNDQFARIEAVVYDRDPSKDGVRLGKGRRQIWASDFKDYVEKCETQAIGRALAVAGFGTQFCDDLDEGDLLADSPTQNNRNRSQHQPNNSKHPDKTVNRATTAPAGKGKDNSQNYKEKHKRQNKPQVYTLIKAEKRTLEDGKVIARATLKSGDQLLTAWAANEEISIADIPAGTILEVSLEQKENAYIITGFKTADKASVA